MTMNETTTDGLQAVVITKSKYPFLHEYATIMEVPKRPIIGRENEMRLLRASLRRPEVSNAFLLADAGVGKTALVKGIMEYDDRRTYMEVDLAKMAASKSGEDGATQMASRVKGLFDDAIRFRLETEQAFRHYYQDETFDQNEILHELVLFIDEFHLLVQLSPEAAQSIKPILAESGVRGIRVIAATTNAEFHEFVEKDQALMQRLQRINLKEPDAETTVQILRSFAVTHGLDDLITDDSLYYQIYEYTNRYIPADAQPRKSILMLDAMSGWCKEYPDDYRMDRRLLADVIFYNTGVRVTFELDATEIGRMLNSRVFSQRYAMRIIEQRLQIAVADLHDKSRPISSFLFTGATGVGKTETVKAMAHLLYGDERAMIRFDMSEYALETSVERFREELTRRVWDRSHAIVLLDEIEKAHSSITRLLLQVLDDGTLTNAQNRPVSFLNTYIVATTNAGTEVYEDIARYGGNDDSEGLIEYQKVIRHSLLASDSFAPELINRMNAIIPFNPLSIETYKHIILRQLEKLRARVYELHRVDLVVHKDVVEFIISDQMDTETNSGGARGVLARFEDEVVSKVAAFINRYKNVKKVGIMVQGEMRISNKQRVKSEGRIVVGRGDRSML